MAGDRILDEPLCRAIARRLGSVTLVEHVDVFPSAKPYSVVAQFDPSYYPPVVDAAELELRAYVGGDFTVLYHERRSDEDWLCRWDRHDNPHNARDHFHPPPDGSTDDAVDAEHPDDVFDVITVVLTAVDDRIGDIWDDGHA